MFGKERKGVALPRGLASVFGQILQSPRHLAIIGGTGAGKTTFVKLLLKLALSEGFRTIVVDWHGEYTSMPSLAYPLRVYRKLLPETLSHIVEEESGTAGYTTYLAVREALDRQRDFQQDLLPLLKRIAETEYSLRLGAVAALSRLTAVEELVELTDSYTPERGSHRLDLGSLEYVKARTLASIYTYQLYSWLKKSGKSEKTLIVLEESQNYSKPSKLLRELRHNNIKVVEIMQSLPAREEQAHQILSNTNLAVGSCGAYSAQLVARYHLPPTLTELEDGEFMVFLNSKTHRVRVF